MHLRLFSSLVIGVVVIIAMINALNGNDWHVPDESDDDDNTAAADDDEEDDRKK